MRTPVAHGADTTSWLSRLLAWASVHQRLLCRASAVVLVIVLYHGSFHGDFAYDDVYAVVNNPDLRAESSWGPLLVHDFWGGNLSSASSHKSFRPLTTAVFRLTYQLGGLSTVYFHSLPIVLHAACCLLVFELTNVLVRDLVTSAVACWLFAAHPVHVDAVASVVGAAEPLCGAFYLSVLLLFLRLPSDGFWGDYVAIGSMTAACLLSKEHAVTLPVALALLTHLLAANGIPARRRHARHWRAVAVCTLVVAVVMAWRLWAAGFSLQLPRSCQDNPAACSPSRVLRLVSYARQHAEYVRLLLWPYTLCMDYAGTTVPLAPAIGAVVPAVTVYAATALCLYWLWMHRYRTPWRTVGVLLLVAAVSFVPSSSLLVATLTVVAERLLYLPSVFVLIASAIAARHLLRAPLTFAVLCTVVFVLLAVRCHSHAIDWQSEFALYRSTAQQCPGSARANYNYANGLVKQGELTLAIAHYRRAIAAEPVHAGAYSNMGVAYLRQNDMVHAEECFLRALQLDPSLAMARQNLCDTWTAIGDPRAVECSPAASVPAS